jgi:hypothetical protein
MYPPKRAPNSVVYASEVVDLLLVLQWSLVSFW